MISVTVHYFGNAYGNVGHSSKGSRIRGTKGPDKTQ